MVITDAKYVNHPTGDQNIVATVDGVIVFIPKNTGNRHYKEILKQVDEGTLTIAEAD